MKSAVVVQARNSSTRYPKKMLHDFLGKPAIEWVIDRCQKIDTDYKILATSEDKDDDILAEIALKKGWHVVRGSVNDVLSRFAKAVMEYGLNIVVRITGDCILTDYRLINYALAKFEEYNVDYLGLSNIIDGFDVEVVRGKAILDADENAILPSEREHVTPFIKDSGRFRVVSLPYGKENLSSVHLSLDYREDAIAIGLILKRFNGIDFTYEDMVELIKAEPYILDSVRHIIPNEGYRKSLKEDEEFLKTEVKSNMRRPLFIAEVSSNHNQDLKRCLEFIDTAADIGCGAVKFQLFKIEELFAPEVLAKRPELRARKQWELPISFIPEIAERCKGRNIKFSCTPFYLEALRELLPYVDFYKIASYELLWSDLLSVCAQTEKPVVLSTGMATIDEVGNAFNVLIRSGCRDLTLLHCVSGYPAPVADCNLSAIATLRNTFVFKASGIKLSFGWSDHSVNPGIMYRAVHHWGAEVVEFHLDIEGKGAEFATGHCWLPEQIAGVIKNIRDGFAADGDGQKRPVTSELPDRDWRADPSDGLRPLIETRKAYR